MSRSRYDGALEVFVYSRAAIERVAPHDVPHVIVSITSSEHDVARLPINPQCRGVLRLSFLDVQQDDRDAFTPQHAALVWKLVDAHPDVNRLLAHCDAGISRSPAVAIAVLEARGGDTRPLFARYMPNLRVLRMLRETR